MSYRDPPAPPATRDVLGFPVSLLSLDEHASYLAACARAGIGRRVVTLNLEMVARATADAAYARLIGCADLFLADGVPLLWLSRLRRGQKIRGRTNGTDLVRLLLTGSSEARIAVIGGIAPHRMLETLPVPSGRVVLVDGSAIDVAPAGVAGIARELSRAGSQLVLVGLGVPKQDVLSAALRAALPTVVIVGVGGSFDLLAGIKPRAPSWMQASGLEWLHRLATEPRRLWRRYVLLYPYAFLRAIRWSLRIGER